ncbi:S-adenosylmethionine mitochondrial carrier protein-like isoform X3 [Salvia divinorum]|uniref:S-adenosylmethionine mitochondrial carrier protein-like isoform X3 n=1 Tax=Salvia divinorum TaxID=28513 RepID=A0ABD1GTT6_SALDI
MSFHSSFFGIYERFSVIRGGLTLRLVMYMIQGALFFASYESFKSLFSLDFPRPSTQALQHEQKSKDDLEILPSAISVAA